jgi:hypothetical protein
VPLPSEAIEIFFCPFLSAMRKSFCSFCACRPLAVIPDIVVFIQKLEEEWNIKLKTQIRIVDWGLKPSDRDEIEKMAMMDFASLYA